MEANFKILVDEKLRTGVGFNLKPPRALYLFWRWSYNDSPGSHKWAINRLEVRSNSMYRAESFTNSVSH